MQYKKIYMFTNLKATLDRIILLTTNLVLIFGVAMMLRMFLVIFEN